MSLFSYEPSPVKNEKTEILKKVEVTSELGKQLNLDIPFVNSKGESVTLRDYTKKGKPVLLSLVYFACPTLCNFHLNGVTDGLKELEWSLGDKFEYVTVSIDHNETQEQAKPKKKAYIDAYGRENASDYWHFLTGKKEDIDNLSSQLGFGYAWNPDLEEWVHPAVLYVLTPDEKISVFLHGVKFERQTLKLALLEASDGKIGTLIDTFAMFCFQYDPNTRKYSLYSYNLMRLAGGFSVLLILVFLGSYWVFKKRIK